MYKFIAAFNYKLAICNGIDFYSLPIPHKDLRLEVASRSPSGSTGNVSIKDIRKFCNSHPDSCNGWMTAISQSFITQVYAWVRHKQIVFFAQAFILPLPELAGTEVKLFPSISKSEKTRMAIIEYCILVFDVFSWILFWKKGRLI